MSVPLSSTNIYQHSPMCQALLTQWTWVWVNSGSWWWTGRPGVLRFTGSQRVRHDWVTELNWLLFVVVYLLSHVRLFCNPMDCNPPNYFAHRISQEIILGWVAISLSRVPYWPRDWTYISCISRQFFTTEPPRKPMILYMSLIERPCCCLQSIPSQR